MNIIERLKAARRVSTPIVAIATPDQPALGDRISRGLGDKKVAVYAWDFVRGLYAKNEAAMDWIAKLGDDLLATPGNPQGALALCLNRKMPPLGILLLENAHRYLQDAGVMQAVMNLRDDFKSDERMVVLLGIHMTLPAEISSDVVQWTEELPDDDRLVEIVAEQVANADGQMTKKPDGKTIKSAAVALRGTSAFGAEQLAAMALRKDGIDIDTLHTQARALIEQTPGLTFERGRETFTDIGGLEFAKTFGKRIFAGPRSPAVVIRVEELDKSMAGARGDLSGTSGDALQVLLSEMEDNNWSGLLAYGAPGAGKSIFAKSLANTHGAKAIRFDLNACKGSLVGQSEKQIRQAMQVIRTIGGDRVFFVASCNRMDSLPPELQRRFRCGVWFFDIPDNEERERIWEINRKRFSVDADDATPDEVDLTGADIRNICEQAYTLGCTLAEARRYVVPLKVQSPSDIEAARQMAKGRFTDASRGGVYDPDGRNSKASGRKVRVAS